MPFGFQLARAVATETALPASSPAQRLQSAAVLTPWSSQDHLKQLAISEAFGLPDEAPVTRGEALTLAAVSDARAHIIEKLAGVPLRALDANGVVATQPTWLYRTDGPVPPWHRLAATLDDWAFYGHSLWAVQRGSVGQITDAAHVPYDRWDVDTNGAILFDNEPVDERAVLYLRGPMDGLVNVASRTIRGAVDLEKSTVAKGRTPVPAILIEEVEEGSMTQEEVNEYVKGVAAARRNPDGAVMFAPAKVRITFHGDVASDLMIDGRNRAALDIAKHLHLPASAIDATVDKASLNYQTQAGTEQTVVDRMSFWSEPLEARLSMDDVVPRGQRIRFDFSPNPADTSTPVTGPYAED
jgi:hypothetical protein